MSEVYIMLSSLISLLILWVLIFWFYRDYCVDAFRQKVFSLRDELFQDGMSGNLPFNHKSYGFLRVTMNGSIRFAHKLNLGLLFLALFSTNAVDYEMFERKVENSVEGLSAEQKELFLLYESKLARLTLTHMLQSSPIIAATIIIPIVLHLVIFIAIPQIIERLSKPLMKISAIAYAAGDDATGSDGLVATAC